MVILYIIRFTVTRRKLTMPRLAWEKWRVQTFSLIQNSYIYLTRLRQKRNAYVAKAPKFCRQFARVGKREGKY